MSSELNQQFLADPETFLKKHLVVECNFDTQRGFYRQFGQFYVEFKHANHGHRLKTARHKPSKFKKAKAIIPVRIWLRPKTHEVTEPSILGQYIPYAQSRVCWEKIHSDTKFVTSYPFNGCTLFLSKSGPIWPVKVMHACSEIDPEQLAVKLPECFGSNPFKKFPLKKYSGREEDDLTTIIGYRAGAEMEFVAQNFLQITNFNSEEIADYIAFNMFRKLKRS